VIPRVFFIPLATGERHRVAVLLVQKVVEHWVRPICAVTVRSFSPNDIPAKVNTWLSEVGKLCGRYETTGASNDH
jgi:hypothetical protein